MTCPPASPPPRKVEPPMNVDDTYATHGVAVEQVRHFKVTVERRGQDWPDVVPYPRGCPLRVERLTSEIDVAASGALAAEGTVSMHGRNVRRDGTLGKPAMRWFFADRPELAWTAKYVGLAMDAILDEPWPELGPAES